MKQLLIIEDDATLRDALKTAFEARGYNVEIAESSELGLVKAVASKPDLIILDVMTYSLHGSTFLQRLRQLPDGQNDSKVIVFTNLDNETTREKVSHYGIDAFLIKSETSLKQIVEKVKEIIGE